MRVIKPGLWFIELAMMSIAGCGADGVAPTEDRTPSIQTAVMQASEAGLSGDREFMVKQAAWQKEVSGAAMPSSVGGIDTQRPPDAGAALVKDDACVGASLWLFDGPGLSGSKICFSGIGDIDLGTFGWAGRVRSYYTGSDAGWFSGRIGTLTGTERFDPYQRRASVSAWVAAASSLSLSNYVSLSSWNYPSAFVRHAYGLGEVATISTLVDKQDATFKVVRGLADSGMVSFESFNYPGYYLRHQDGRVKLVPYAGDALFSADATFNKVPGLTGADTVSFESKNYPGFYIRHSAGHLYVHANDGSDLFKADASYVMSAPWVH